MSTVSLRDLANFAKVNEIMAQYFPQPWPARAAIGVAQLPRGPARAAACPRAQSQRYIEAAVLGDARHPAELLAASSLLSDTAMLTSASAGELAKEILRLSRRD